MRMAPHKVGSSSLLLMQRTVKIISSAPTSNFSSTVKNLPDRRPSKVLNTSSSANVEDDFTITNWHENHPSKSSTVSTDDDQSAYHVAMKMRQADKSIADEDDTKATDEYSRTVKFFKKTDLSKLPSEKLARIIRKHVIYADKQVVVFNKPYGVASHDGDKVESNIKEVLPIVSKMIHGVRSEVPLTLCHRLESHVTGTMVCCSDAEKAKELFDLFRQQKVLKCYWAITLGQPCPHVGKIEIPLVTHQTSKTRTQRSHQRTRCSPFVRYDSSLGKEVANKRYRGTPAITYYRTLSSTVHASLVEFQPRSNFKHQIRAHSAEGLACPILGDHKYSHGEMLRPQYLSKYMQEKLKIHKSKTRYLPMHLHLRKVLIPNCTGNAERPHLAVIAKIPQHFERSIKVLGLRQNTKAMPDEWHGLSEINRSASPLAEPRNTEDDDHHELYHDPTIDESNQDKPRDDRSTYFSVYKPRITVKYKA